MWQAYRSISPYISAFSSSIPQQPILASLQYRITLSKSPIIVHQVHALVPGRVSPKTYGSGLSIPILLSNTDLNSSTTWQPSAQLPYGRHNHPLDSACDPETLTALIRYCNRPATVIFAQHFKKEEMHMATKDLRDLLSHSSPIADETITFIWNY